MQGGGGRGAGAGTAQPGQVRDCHEQLIWGRHSPGWYGGGVHVTPDLHAGQAGGRAVPGSARCGSSVTQLSGHAVVVVLGGGGYSEFLGVCSRPRSPAPSTIAQPEP